MAGNQKIYHLDIDGPQLRRQRELLFLLMEAADESRTFDLGPEQFAVLDGLVNLTDDIADQAHDKYGIDCLLTNDEESETQTVELDDSGCLEYETGDGTVRYRDQFGNTQDVHRPGDDGYDDRLEQFQTKRKAAEGGNPGDTEAEPPVEVELPEGGRLELRKDSGEIFKYGTNGTLMVTRVLGDDGYDEWLALFCRRAGRELTTDKLSIEITYDPGMTDVESLAVVEDRVLETVPAMPGILDDYGNPTFGEFYVLEENT